MMGHATLAILLALAACWSLGAVAAYAYVSAAPSPVLDTALARAFGGARHFLPSLAFGAAAANLAAAALAFTWIGRGRRMRALLGRLVPAAVVDKMIDGQLQLGGQRCEVTVLLVDIRDFTQLSEKLSPEELVLFLNDYFSRMIEIVLRNGGCVDKFMGDGLLAVFGAPAEQKDHAARAVTCAMEMHFCLERLNAERSKRGLQPIRFGVAINTGSAIAGLVGSRERMEYTVVGDVVNTVSRIESLNPRLGTELLATEATYKLTRDLFAYKAIGRVCVRGRKAPVGVYQLLGPTGPLAAAREGGKRLKRAHEPSLQGLHLSRVLKPAEIDAHVLGRA